MVDTLHAELRDAVTALLRARRERLAQFALLALLDAIGRAAALLSSGLVTAQPAWGNERRDALVQSTHTELEAALTGAVPFLPADVAEEIARGVRVLLKPLHQSQTSYRTVSAGPAVAAPDHRPSAQAAPEQSFDDLRFGASVPGRLRSAVPAVARFVAYAADQDAQAHRMLGADKPGRHQETDAGAARIATGTEVEVALSGRGLLVDGGSRGVQPLVWTGRPVLLAFEIEPIEGSGDFDSVLRFEVMVDGLTIATVLIETRVTNSAEPEAVPSVNTGQRAQTKAFASYSSLDRPRVLDRVASIRLFAQVDVFLDCHDLNPGEPWRSRLEREIDGCDAFLLFWSQHAAGSGWVRWEYERALQTRGLQHMQFHPLDNSAKPPAGLQDLHFTDPLADLRWAAMQRQTERAAKGGGS